MKPSTAAAQALGRLGPYAWTSQRSPSTAGCIERDGLWVFAKREQREPRTSPPKPAP